MRHRKRKRKRRNQVNDAPMFMRVSALPGQPIPSGMRQIKREKKKRKEGGGRHTVIGFMLLAVRCQ